MTRYLPYLHYLRIAFSISCGIACVLLLVLWVRSYWARPNCRETTFPNQVTFLANLPSGPKGKAVYFSVRIGERDESIIAEIPVRLRLRNQEYELPSLSFDDVRQMGGDVTADVPGPSRTHFGFVGWGTQNQDGGIEFYFSDGILTEFYARWHKEEPSPFALIPSSGTSLNFPFSDDELLQALGKPKSIVDLQLK